jgi:hypothetical protein
MFDIALSAFSLFFTQNPSFLQFQRDMEKTKGKSNAQTLFQIDLVPSDNHIRNMMDEVPPSLVYPVFNCIFDTMNEHGYLDMSKVLTVTCCERMISSITIIPNTFILQLQCHESPQWNYYLFP